MSTNYNEGSVLRKASSVITAEYKGGIELDPKDRLLMNYLLFRSWSDLRPDAIYRIPTKEIMEYARFKRHSDLQKSVNRLSKMVLEIDYEDESGDARCITAHYLSADISQSENGLLHYAFDPILYHFIAHPKVYGVISIPRVRDMNTSQSIDLYEIMALQYRKKSPVFRTTPDDLRKLLKVGDKHPRPDNFRKNVIEKTIAEVNAIAEFDIIVDYIKGGKGGAVVEIVFEAVPKSHARLVQAASTSKVTKGRTSLKNDTSTIDMLDGMTGKERGSQAALSDRSIEGAREIIPADGNINEYMTEWHSLNKDKVFNDPDTAFLSWLKVRVAKDEDPILKDLDIDVFGEILDLGGE